MSDGAKGVIYVWSPHMPLSVDAFRHVASATEALGVALTVVVDPAGDPAYARAMARSAEMPVQAVRPFSSVELLFRNATVHAPSVLVYADRRILGLAIPGYRDATGYRTIIQQRLED